VLPVVPQSQLAFQFPLELVKQYRVHRSIADRIGFSSLVTSHSTSLAGRRTVPLLACPYVFEPMLKINGTVYGICDPKSRDAAAGRTFGTRMVLGSPLVSDPQYLPPSPKALTALFAPPHTIISLPVQTAV
jgi:hypothetical protein